MVPTPAARSPVPLSSAGGAPVRPRRASSRATPVCRGCPCARRAAPVCRGCACAPAPRVLPRHARLPGVPLAPAALRPSAGGGACVPAPRVLPRHAYAPRAAAPPPRPPGTLSRTGRTRPRSSSGTPCPQTAGRAAGERVVLAIDQQVLAAAARKVAPALHEPIPLQHVLGDRRHLHERFRQVVQQFKLVRALIQVDALPSVRGRGLRHAPRRQVRHRRVAVDDLHRPAQVLLAQRALARPWLCRRDMSAR